jgi:4-hydroxy-tetrahydrodipicolinate synthase
VRALDRKTLSGLWAAVPTPWTPEGRIDEGALGRNCKRYVSARADGVYTTDSDGEFYAIELDGFRQLARSFARAMEPTGLDAAMGVAWCNTQGIIDRILIACDAGIPNVHVAFPFWMPMSRQDVPRFFEDLSRAAPEARWIHYQHPKAGPQLSGADYAGLSRQFPDQLIGTKLGVTDTMEITEILTFAPELAHFMVEPTLLAGALLGARGCYSYWINTMPRWERRFVDACLSGRWEEAATYHKKLMCWELLHIRKLRQAGHLHGIIGKARAALTGFLEDSGLTKPPYYPVSPQMQAELRGAFLKYWAEELQEEDLLRR